LFHISVAEGKNDFLNLSVLDIYKVKFAEFLRKRPDLCCTVWGNKSDKKLGVRLLTIL
jgi:hypothetical protein